MNTIKATMTIFTLVFLTGVLFNITILKTYASAKTLEANKIARLKAATVNRLPAVVMHSRALKR